MLIYHLPIHPAVLHPAVLHPAVLHPAVLHPAVLHPACSTLILPNNRTHLGNLLIIMRHRFINKCYTPSHHIKHMICL